MVDSSVSYRFPPIHLKNRRTFTLFTSSTSALGKLGENSDRSGSIVGNQAEYSDKTENDLADAASRAGASMQMMEIGIASYTMKNIVLPGISLALEICPNLGPNVFWVKIRTRGSQPRICVRIFAQFTSTVKHTSFDSNPSVKGLLPFPVSRISCSCLPHHSAHFRSEQTSKCMLCRVMRLFGKVQNGLEARNEKNCGGRRKKVELTF